MTSRSPKLTTVKVGSPKSFVEVFLPNLRPREGGGERVSTNAREQSSYAVNPAVSSAQVVA